MATDRKIPITTPRKSATFDDYTLSQIRRAAATGLRHEGAHMADRAPHYDVDSLHGDAAAGRGVAADHDEAALSRGARGL